MGFLGRVTGWDQQKDAHNAVLANHLAETASPELRREIVTRLILMQQQIRGDGAGDPHAIVTDLSGRSRIVQMNFIALICNNLGTPSGLPGLSFATVENPYRADDENSLNRIGVAIDDLSRRSGRRSLWPGNHERINFLTWGGLRSNPDVLELEIEAPDIPLNPEYAAHLAYRSLLAEMIDFDAILGLAKELAGGIGARSDKELALATALFFFEKEELKEVMHPIQMMARLTMLDWLQEGSVQPATGHYFEDQLYEVYNS